MVRSIDPDFFSELHENWRNKRVLILGDFILDEFIYGTTDRVSREAPVVVVRYDRDDFCPGGAANASKNIVSLGGKASAVGIIGRDRRGSVLKGILRGAGVSVRGLVSSTRWVTTCKTRIMGGDYHAQRQQVVRVDRESREAISREDENRLLKAYEREVQRADAVILSDYDQGVFSRRIIRESVKAARKRKIPVVADSRFRLNEFKGVTAATPNEVEAAEAAGITLKGEKSVDRAARYLLDELSASSILITRGKYGMTLYREGMRRISVPVIGSDEATDVTGAGDTVAAVIGLALAAGGELADAMKVANAAASIVVMKRGTAVAGPEEIKTLLQEVFDRN